MMNRIRLLTLGMALLSTLQAIAYPTTTASTQQVPDVDQHLQMLSKKLDLTADQREVARPPDPSLRQCTTVCNKC